VTAACSGEKAESHNLEAVVLPIAASCNKIDKSQPETFDLAVRDHVHSVAGEVLAQSEMLKNAVEHGKLTIIEAYYSLDTGAVTSCVDHDVPPCAHKVSRCPARTYIMVVIV
jgi:carbonic anhydrase